ncbi:type IV toxin-antitoxin system AbiEi family antitoxin [Actinoplanes sp. CA-015351]|uniref:type IV toxin-antitoxin system AbiEi family antitoxin n=1 Tax=Actinoplanes sp. CA-015351 TaxID=3239897 RepID=UPI003D993B1D
MSIASRIPPELIGVPFRASSAVAAGLITRAMLSGPVWRRLFRDVYAHEDLALDHRGWCTAAMLALPASTAIGGASAACLWGVSTPLDPTTVHVVAPRGIRLHRDPRIVVHYTGLAAADVCVRNGLRLTTPERTIFDLGRRTGRADALVTLDAMLHRHLIDPAALRKMIGRRERWPGTARLGALLPLAEPRSESPMETRLRLVLVDAGVPPPVAQFEIRDARGVLLGRADLAWPELRLAAEYEGDHHRQRDQFRQDVERFNKLRMAGWTVLRFTADDVLRRPDRTAAMVKAALTGLNPARAVAQRGHQPG